MINEQNLTYMWGRCINKFVFFEIYCCSIPIPFWQNASHLKNNNVASCGVRPTDISVQSVRRSYSKKWQRKHLCPAAKSLLCFCSHLLLSWTFFKINLGLKLQHCMLAAIFHLWRISIMNLPQRPGVTWQLAWIIYPRAVLVAVSPSRCSLIKVKLSLSKILNGTNNLFWFYCCLRERPHIIPTLLSILYGLFGKKPKPVSQMHKARSAA